MTPMIETGNREGPEILIVDDEVEILNSLIDLLRKDFYIFATSNVEEAQTLLVDHTMLSLIISDQRMPVLTGVELLARAAQSTPDTARILLTGYTDIDAAIAAVNHGQIVQYITKPWNSINLLSMLKSIAQKHRLLLENRQLIQQLAHLSESTTDLARRVESLQTSHSRIENDNAILRTAYDLLDKSFWHLRKIQEVLPICMACGKVKTSDAGWEDVLSFLKKNSMFLSHGYCPECAEHIMRENKTPPRSQG